MGPRQRPAALLPAARPAPGRWLAAPVIAALVVHAAYKLEHDALQEMLWSCHVASALIAFGILVRAVSLVAVGAVFQFAMGLPSYVVDWVATGETTASSVLVHTVPPVVAVLALRRLGAWPRWVPVASGLLYVALLILCRWITRPSLNVNLAFEPWAPSAALGPTWSLRALNLVMMAALLPVIDRALRAFMRASSARAGATA